MICAYGVMFRNSWVSSRSWSLSLKVFFLKVLQFLVLHLSLCFVEDLDKDFSFLHMDTQFFQHHLLKKLSFLLEKAMAPPSSTLAWKLPWTEEPGRLQSMGSLGVRHDWATSLSLFTFMHWRRKWQPTPVFLPGESQGRRSLVGCRLWVHTESDTTEAT